MGIYWGPGFGTLDINSLTHFPSPSLLCHHAIQVRIHNRNHPAPRLPPSPKAPTAKLHSAFLYSRDVFTYLTDCTFSNSPSRNSISNRLSTTCFSPNFYKYNPSERAPTLLLPLRTHIESPDDPFYCYIPVFFHSWKKKKKKKSLLVNSAATYVDRYAYVLYIPFWM